MNAMQKNLQFLMSLKDNVSPQGNTIIRLLTKMDNEVARVTRGFQRTGPKIKSWFAEASAGASRLRSNLANLPSKILNLPSLIAASAVGLTLGIAVDAASFKTTQSKAFELMLGNKAAGDSLLKQSTDFANLTPFGTRDILDTTRSLAQSFAPNEIPNLLAAIGDVGAVNNFDAQTLSGLSRALNQIKRRGILQGDEVEQLSEWNVPIQGMYEKLAQMRGVTVPDILKLQASGGIGADEAIYAITDAIRTEVSGGTLGTFMKVMSREIPGLLSTLRSKAFEVFMDLDTKPIKRFLTNLVNLTDTSTALGARFKNALNASFGKVLEIIFNPLANATEPETIVSWLENLEGKFSTFNDWWTSSMPGILEWVRSFGEGFVSSFQSAWNILETFIPSLSGLNVMTGDATAASGKFWGQLAAVATMLGLVNVATGGLAGSLASGLLPMLGQVLTKMGLWGWVIAGVAGGFALLYSKVEWFRTGVGEVLAQLDIMFQTTFNNIATAIDWVIEKFNNFLSAADKFHQSGVGQQRGQAFMNWLGLGQDAAGGLNQGLQQGQPLLQKTTDDMVGNTAGRYQEQMGIQSPSRLMAWQGRMWGQGLASGIRQSLPLIDSAVESASTATSFSSPLASGSYSPMQAGSSSASSITVPQITIQISGAQDPKAVGDELESRVRSIFNSLMRQAAGEVTGGI